MPDWKILITDGLEENGLVVLRAASKTDDRSGIGADELLQIIPEYDALVVRGRTKLDRRVFEAAKRLKVVGRAGVGVDNIDLQASKAHHVTVVNTPTATSMAVAELTLGLMLALARSIPQADMATKKGQWIKKDLLGIEIYGKKLGVIGMGNIGSTVAQRATALGMSALGFDTLLPTEEISHRGGKPVSLAELFVQADFISVHVPLISETRNLLDRRAFQQMKPGVFLLCTARGGIVDEDALLEALESGQVAGAALDVYAQEPPGASPLVTHPHVIATPHIGAQTQEAQIRAAKDIADEVLAALSGQPLRWKIT